MNQNFLFRKVRHTTLSLTGTVVPGFQRMSRCPGRLTACPREYQFHLFITPNSLLYLPYSNNGVDKKLCKSIQTTQCLRLPCKNAVDSMLLAKRSHKLMYNSLSIAASYSKLTAFFKTASSGNKFFNQSFHREKLHLRQYLPT